MTEEKKEPQLKLIEEYVEQKTKLKEMVIELEKLKIGIEKIFPEKLDVRYSRFLEEKIKAVTELFRGILDIRKEISKSIKEELELRSKYVDGNREDDENNIVGDIRSIARKLEQLNRDDEKLKKENEK
jgi:hypothetical protein